MGLSCEDEVDNKCIAKAEAESREGQQPCPSAKQLNEHAVWTRNLTQRYHDNLCEWMCLPTPTMLGQGVKTILDVGIVRGGEQ